jgi:hypothetical protein
MPRKATRIVTAALALSVVLLALAAAIVYVASERRLNARHPLPISTIRVPQDAASIERGRHLFRAIGSCTLCHGEDGGGRIYEESALLGVIAGPNLTRGRGGVGTTFRDADWDRAIRFGLHADGRSLLIMPSEVFVNMSDEDACALIAYIKQLTPVDRVMPPTRLHAVGRAMLAAGSSRFWLHRRRRSVTAYSQEPTTRRGAADTSRTSAGATGATGTSFGWPRRRPAGTAAGIEPHADRPRRLDRSRFRARDARRPPARWPPAARFHALASVPYMTDAELHALWLYLESVSPKPFGQK